MTYAYRCNLCNLELDLFRSFIKRNDPVTCSCGGDMHLIQIPKREDGCNRCHMWTPKKIR